VKVGFVSAVKSALVPAGKGPRRMAFGLYKGLTFEVDFRHETQLYLGLWERETYGAIRTAMSRCSWAVDVGAGHGELCVWLMRSHAPGPFFAFEPQVSSLDALRRNAALNHCANDRRLIVVAKLAGPATTNESVAIDDLPLDREKRGFLKVDVDGAEMVVLEGAKGVLAEGIVDVLIETHSAALERQCVAFLSDRRYACTVIRNAWWRAILPEQRPIAHNRWLWATKAEP
jgi:hypothetical protein